MELFHKDKFKECGLDLDFVQENCSYSKRGVIRGLHFQWKEPLGKLMRITRGAAFVVAVDIRKSSPSFGAWFGIEISEENKKQLYASPGFACGFQVLGSEAFMSYHYTSLYNPAAEASIVWNDPLLKINWPGATDYIVSERDSVALSFEEWLKRPDADLL